MPKAQQSKANFAEPPIKESQTQLEVYKSFMIGYVNRINQSTLRVKIGGVRIGTAKYSRLAQINLKTRIITFSRYAIENVPERGRRYLVIHELAHVKEANHNRRFWEWVARYEPNYREIGNALEKAFKKNVRVSEHSLVPLEKERLFSSQKEIKQSLGKQKAEEGSLIIKPAGAKSIIKDGLIRSSGNLSGKKFLPEAHGEIADQLKINFDQLLENQDDLNDYINDEYGDFGVMEGGSELDSEDFSPLLDFDPGN